MKSTAHRRSTAWMSRILGPLVFCAIAAPAPGQTLPDERPLEFSAARITAEGLRSLQAGAPEPAEAGTRMSSRQALVPALMSAVVPGSGQVRNGSLLKGIAFAAVELTGWMAWFSFDHQADEKYGDLGSFGGRYWDFERYRRVAQNPDSCQVHGCGCNLYSASADSLIRLAEAQGGSRFYDYLTRDAYACGWDTQLSRDLYLELHGDREDLLDAKRITGRLIFLNHAVAAVDAFLQARRVRVAGLADVRLRMSGLPGRPHTELVFSAPLN